MKETRPIAAYVTAQVLPAAGAFFTTAPIIENIARFRYWAFYINYAAGAINGNASFRLKWFDNLGNAFSDTRAFAPGVLIEDVYTGIAVPAFPGSSLYIVQVENPGGAARLRLEFAEVGVPATPGTITIEVSAEE